MGDVVEQGQPSRTALSIALIRAAHQLRPSPRLFEDPLAASISGFAVGELPEQWIPELLHPWILARFRVAEDAIGAAVAAGTRQLVILGAGLDTFGYRNPYPDLRVFEVDHPSTQAWKQERLRAAGIDVPASVSFVTADFEQERWDAALEPAGFDRSVPTIFVCLGVVMYLTERATLNLFARTAAFDAHTELVVDYVDLSAARSPERRAVGDPVLAEVADQGEPWQCYFAPDELAQHLRALGFDAIVDASVPEVLSRYGVDAAAKYDVFSGHILHAARR
ncbi:SAM-dependent methyltransferase [Nocardia sp. NPDC050712]|uniref:class I SAM-dependent methyltransferase n=1 Tax=Nocardia sp. NPDC050712 TaxID=3155518 RepID=UPI0033E47230